MSRPIKIAFLTIDKREFLKNYQTDTPTFGTAPEALLQGFSGLDGIEVHVISCLQQPVRTVDRLAKNIIPHALIVPKLGWMRTLYQGCVRAVRRQLHGLRPDIVHGQGTERDCALSAVYSGFPNVITIHGNMRRVATVTHARPFSFHWLAARLEAFAVKRTHGIVCISQYTQALVKFEARRTWVVPNAVDASFLQVQRGCRSSRRFLVAGTICSHKNQNFLIHALDPLAAQEEFHIHFIGDLPSNDSYGREFMELVSSRRWCSYTGFADRERLKQLLSESVALLIPSLEDNCPMVVLEAAAAGVPAIGSHIGGIPGLIDHGVTGFLFSINDRQALLEAARRVILNPAEAEAMGRAAKQKALQHFTPDAIARRHLGIYQEVLQMPR